MLRSTLNLRYSAAFAARSGAARSASSSSSSSDINQHIAQSTPRATTLAVASDQGSASKTIEQVLLKTARFAAASASSSSSSSSSPRPSASPRPASSATSPSSSSSTSSSTRDASALSKLGSRLVLKRKEKGILDLDAKMIASIEPLQRPRSSLTTRFIATRYDADVARTSPTTRLAAARELRASRLDSAKSRTAGGEAAGAEAKNPRQRGQQGASAVADGRVDGSPSRSAAASSRPRNSTSAASSTGSAPRAGGPRSPMKPRGSTGNVNNRRGPSSKDEKRSPTVLLPTPTKYLGIPSLDLAALIRQDLNSRVLQLKPKKSGVSTVEERIEARNEAMGDYSRYLSPSQLTESGDPVSGTGLARPRKLSHVEVARRILTANSSIGLQDREFLVEKVQSMMKT